MSNLFDLDFFIIFYEKKVHSKMYLLGSISSWLLAAEKQTTLEIPT